MITAAEITEIGQCLATASGGGPAALDLRIDTMNLAFDSALLRHAKHQALMRTYQNRYVLLPSATKGSVVQALQRRYDPEIVGRLETLRAPLEAELIAPGAEAARRAAEGQDITDYIKGLVPGLQREPENAFTTFLRQTPKRAHHYRDFLLQSAADLLAEASASALGVVGDFGPPQSALFRILIDEFGYGVHDRKHSVLYQAVMRGFGLCDQYDNYFPLFDTVALELHNTIHYLFQNPRNFFLQIGFLLYAETAYQRSTQDHFRYLRQFHPDIDARYFGEHAHIDLHHSTMIIDQVIAPMVDAYGSEVGIEIIAGAELTRTTFARAGAHLLAVSKAFAAAVASGDARYAAPSPSRQGVGLVPGSTNPAGAGAVEIQVGGLGVVTCASVFDGFPPGAFGRLLDRVI